jgi:hypothetical protein
VSSSPEIYTGFRSGTTAPLRVVSGSIPEANGLTNFSVALQNASTGQTIAATGSQAYLYGYEVDFRQNSTGEGVRLSLARGVAPRDASASITLFPAWKVSDESYSYQLSYDRDRDAFTTVVDDPALQAGNYSWSVSLDFGGKRMIAIDTDENVSVPAGVGTSIEFGIFSTSGTTVDGQEVETPHFRITSNRNLTLENGSNYHFLVTNEDTQETVTLAFDGSATATPETSLFDSPEVSFNLYSADGSVRSVPTLDTGFKGTTAPARVVNGTIPETDGLANFSVALQNASTGQTIAETGTRAYLYGYEIDFQQNSTSGNIRLSLDRNSAPRSADVSVRLDPPEGPGSGSQFLQLSYDPNRDAFTTVINDSTVDPGNYSWRASLRFQGEEMIDVSDGRNVTVNGTEHESGVSRRVFDAVAGNDETLQREEVVSAVRVYLSDDTVGGTSLSRDDVIELVRYYLQQ